MSLLAMLGVRRGPPSTLASTLQNVRKWRSAVCGHTGSIIICYVLQHLRDSSVTTLIPFSQLAHTTARGAYVACTCQVIAGVSSVCSVAHHKHPAECPDKSDAVAFSCSFAPS